METNQIPTTFHSPKERRRAIRNLLKNQTIIDSAFSKILKTSDIVSSPRKYSIISQNKSPIRKTTLSLTSFLPYLQSYIKPEFDDIELYPMLHTAQVLAKLCSHRKVYIILGLLKCTRYALCHKRKKLPIYIY